MRIGKVKFLGWSCDVLKKQYYNGRIALALVDSFDGEPVATATVNMPEIDLAEDEVIIKNYSENEGILEVLTAAGIVQPTGRIVESGFVTMEICKLVK